MLKLNSKSNTESKSISKNIFFDLEKKILFFSVFVIFFVFFYSLSYVTSWGPSGNYENYSVRTTVNITNAYPEILAIICNSGSACYPGSR